MNAPGRMRSPKRAGGLASQSRVLARRWEGTATDRRRRRSFSVRRFRFCSRRSISVLLASGEEQQTLWALDRAWEAHVARLIGMARRTTSDALRQDVVDRLIAMNRCSDSLISRPGVNARAASSFRRALLAWSRRAELQRSSLGVEKALEWRVKDKDHGYRLAGMLGAALLTRRGPFSAEDALANAAEALGPVVVKPVGGAGSPGVFVVYAPQAILDLQRQQWIANLDALRTIMNELRWDRWLSRISSPIRTTHCARRRT